MSNILGYRDVEDGDTEYTEVTSRHPLPVTVLSPVGGPDPGWHSFSLLALGTNNLVNVIGASRIGAISVSNHAATERLLRVYDLNRPAVVATDGAAVVLRIVIPATATGAARDVPIPLGGLALIGGGFAISTTTVVTSDTDGTSVTAGDMQINILWR